MFRLASFPREGWWSTLKNKPHINNSHNRFRLFFTPSLILFCFRGIMYHSFHTNQMKIFQLPCKCNIKSQRRQFENGVVSRGYHRSRQKNFACRISKRKRLCQTVYSSKERFKMMCTTHKVKYLMLVVVFIDPSNYTWRRACFAVNLSISKK